MQTVEYVLRPRNLHGEPADSGVGFVGFDLAAELRGKRLGNNVQAVVRSPNDPNGVQDSRVPDADAILQLPSGWLVIPRNQFADQPQIARVIFESAVEQLEGVIEWSRTGAPLESAVHEGVRGDGWFLDLFFGVVIRATGPDYWR